MPRTGTQKDGRLARKALRLAGGDPLKAAELLRAEAETVSASKPGVDGYILRRKIVSDALVAATRGGNTIPRWIQEAMKDEGVSDKG